MTSATDLAAGTPIWVDVTSPDVQAAARFYGSLFGWDAEDLGEAAGHYTMFRKGGKMVAAASAPMAPGAPPAWTTYVATDDASATVAKVRQAGGTVVMDAMAVMDAGSMAVFQGPDGSFIAVWQRGNHKGAELCNEPGSFTWNELQSRDIDAAKRFYPAVFGWGVKDNAMGAMTYTEWQLDGKSIAGAMTMMPGAPETVPSNWVVYFAVDDTDAAVTKIQELGGRLLAPAMDSPAGRFAVVADPQGAMFAVIKIQR
jgi:uncharacterized protein